MRWIIRIIVTLVVLVMLAIVALLLIPADRIAAIAATRFEAATGRQMVISGGVHPTLWPELGIRTGGVQIANAPWSKQGPMLSAEGLTVGVDPVALLSGAVKVGRVDLIAPKIVLERDKDGHGNWEMAGSAPATGTAAPATTTEGGGLPALSIDRATITGGAVTWIDDAAGTTQTVDGIDATLKLPDAAGPLDLTAAAQVNRQPVSVTLHLDKLAAVTLGQPTPVALKLVAGGSTVGFTGTADTGKLAVQGTLDADLGDLSALFAAAGLADPGLPQGLGAKRIAAKGMLVAGADGSVTLDQATLTLDGNTLTGKLGVTTAGARPKLTAILSAGKLDLKALGGSGGAAGSGGTSAAGWSKAPIDASPLSLADADVTLGAAGLDLGTVTLGQTDVAVQLVAGKATVALKQVAAYQGTISGQIVVDGAKGLAVSSDLTVNKVALQPILTDFAGYTRLHGTGTAKIALNAAGGSMDALMHALAGSGSITFGQGELDGFDLAGMLTHLNANYMGAGAKTIFDSITGSYTVKAGVLSNSDLAFKSPLVDASGKGTVDIGGRTMDYTVTPVALQGVAGANGISVPLKISGGWDAPKFGLDMTSGVGQQIDAQKKKLEDKAKAEAAKALGLSTDTTGTSSGTSGTSVKDAAKQGLLKLLGGN
ncbi:MAG: AsmA family protein [Rhodobacteraceae bacterium]|nr:AsmA family protein [Paracoccaceae bacterium]